MGLDNGIVLVTKHKIKQEDIPDYIDLSDYKEENNSYSYDICYWRKCWGLRNWFLREAYPNWDLDQYRFQMTEREVNILLKIIRHYLRHPEDWNDSIWEFDEIKPCLREQQWNLVLLRTWMRKHPDAYVYFYDSY